jgi:hypothetical protein
LIKALYLVKNKMRHILELKQSLTNRAIAQETWIPLGTVQDYIVGKSTKPNDTILDYVNDRIERYKRSVAVNSPTTTPKRPLE